MATSKSTKQTAAKGPAAAGTALANWEEELAKQAQVAVQDESTAATGGGRFFSTRAGVLTYDDAKLPGNQMAVVILDSIMENVYYEGKFDPEQKTPPTCFAFGRDADTMEPHEEVDKHEEFTRQSDLCADCIRNEWGSAETGKGKACSNRRRLSLIPAGTYIPQGRGGGFELELEDDESVLAKAEAGYLKLPVMSVKGYAAYMKQVAEQFRRPLHAVVTRVWLEPDPKSQFRVNFELIDTVPDHMIPVVMARHNAASKEIDFPYIPRAADEEGEGQKPAKANNKLRGGKAAPAKSARRK